MPSKIRFKRSRKRPRKALVRGRNASYNKNKRNNGPIRCVIRGFQSSDQLMVKLRYESSVGDATYHFTTAAGSNSFIQSSCNDLDGTGAGHQPRGYDQWCSASALYTKYRILAMRITYDCINNGTMPVAIAQAWYDVVPSATGIDDHSEAKYSQVRTIGQATGSSRTKIKTYMNSKKIHGMTTLVNEETTSAVYNANPTDMYYSYLNVAAIDLITAINVWVRVKVVVYVTFFEQNNVAAS